MKRAAASTWVILLLLTGVARPARADLDSDIRAVLRDKLLQNAQVGIEIVRLGQRPGQSAVLYRHDEQLPLIPASNLKLATTSAAVERLGADFVFRTLLVMTPDGDLVLWGDGDPTLGDWEMLHKVGWDVTTVFQTWAGELLRRNINSVGNVIVDDSVFDQEFLHPNWPADQENEHYVAQVGGVNLNANLLNFAILTTAPGQPVRYTTDPPTQYASIRNQCLTGQQNAIWFQRPAGTNDITLRGEADRSTDVPVTITIHDPPLYAATVLAETIQAQGIRITGSVKRDRTVRSTFAALTPEQRKTWTLVAVYQTRLPQVLARTNKDSMNLYAEALCKRLGFAVKGEGTWANGTAAVGEFLNRLGVPDRQFHLDDGCGLSKENRISAQALVGVLIHDFDGPNRQVFLDSLAVGGVDGTLDHRFVGSDLQGRVLAKSGYVSGVSSLSGYLRARDEHWYAFSILMNALPRGMNSAAKVLQERIVKAVDQSASLTRPSR